MTDLHAGSALGRYELLLPIAKGGMAQVWAARLLGSRGFQKLVAVKTILAGAVDNARMEQMFLEEAQLASQIHHPNVVHTLDLGEHEGVLYLVMEWVEGEPLNALLAKAAQSGGVPLAIGVNLIGQACQGLSAAHELRDDQGALLGVVHRDVSPQNLLISYSGTAKLVDFGIAKATSKQSGLTEAGEIKGKFAYMAPEQVRGHRLDQRTDLFALGILLYAITTGRHPFRGENPAETVQNICAEQGPTPPSAFIADYPERLEQVLMKALAKRPDDRFSSATEFLTALEDAMPGPLEASFNTQVAEYMKTLFGNRASERRAAIRVAQENADKGRQRADTGSSSISVGTLRAISIDQSMTPSAPQMSPFSGTLPSPLPPPPSPKRPLYIGATVGLLAVALGAGWGLRGNVVSGEKAAASSPVPIVSLDQLRAAPSAAASAKSQPAEAPRAAEESPAAAPSAVTTATEETSKKRPGRAVSGYGAGHAARYAVPATAAAAPGGKEPSSPSPSPAPAAAASPAPQASPAAPTANAWDRGAFGGRH